jgi:hypothetical protein
MQTDRQTDRQTHGEASGRFLKFCVSATKVSDVKRHKHQFAAFDVLRNNLYMYFTLFKGKLRAGVAHYDFGPSILFPIVS